MKIFTKPCDQCGDTILGPREGGLRRGQWLGYNYCQACRAAVKPSADALLAQREEKL